MTQIWIVNHTASGCGPYVESWSSYHHTEDEARKAYAERLGSVSEDPNLVTLTRLDTVTLEATMFESWEGTDETLRIEEDEDDDWICEGKPDADL